MLFAARGCAWAAILHVASAQYDTPLNTTKATVGWVNGPNYRSTSDIILSCLLTMSLCVWSALHLNIPGAQEKLLKRWLRNTGWICLGIFGPELIMFAAYKNYAAAKSLQDLIDTRPKCVTCDGRKTQTIVSVSECQCRGEGCNVEPSQLVTEWTLLHGYYATMGGFVFDLGSEAASIILDVDTESARLTVTPQGLQMLAECGIIPQIPARDIEDKNKSDGLTKGIVILQAGWMILQSVSRLAYSLPVTLLEVNTVGHVICALFIFILWWKKPREVTEPTVIRGSWVPAMVAYMTMSSDLDDTEGWREWASLKPPLLPEFSNLKFERDMHRSDQENGTEPNTSQAKVIVTCSQGTTEVDDFSYTPYTRNPGFGSLKMIAKPRAASGLKREKSFIYHLEHSRFSRSKRDARWHLALDAMEMFPHLCCRLDKLHLSIDGEVKNYQPQVMLQERASNWPTKGSIPAFPGKLIGMALWLASIAFGAVHVAAWNEYFPSIAEKWLWRGSSLYLAWAGSLWLTICFLGSISKRFDAIWDRCITGRADRMVYVCLVPICALCGVLYAFARVFLVVESVAALRSMPPETYITPEWPQVIPHL